MEDFENTRFDVVRTCLFVGCSPKTIDNWYRFKKENPDSELAKMLPEFEQEHSRGARYWTKESLQKLIDFKENVPKGRNGKLSSVTQRYYHKKKGN